MLLSLAVERWMIHTPTMLKHQTRLSLQITSNHRSQPTQLRPVSSKPILKTDSRMTSSAKERHHKILKEVYQHKIRITQVIPDQILEKQEKSNSNLETILLNLIMTLMISMVSTKMPVDSIDTNKVVSKHR